MDWNNLADLTAQPKPLRVGDDTFLLHPLDVGDFGALQAWIDAQQPDPFAVYDRVASRYPIAQQRALFDKAMELAARPGPKLGTAEADGFLQSLEGAREILYLSIRKGDPSFSRARAEEVFKRLGVAGVARALALSHADQLMGADDPKAAGEAATPRPPSTGGGSTTGS